VILWKLNQCQSPHTKPLREYLLKKSEQIYFEVFAIFGWSAYQHVLSCLSNTCNALILQKMVLKPYYLAQVALVHWEEFVIWLIVPHLYLNERNPVFVTSDCEYPILIHGSYAQDILPWEKLFWALFVQAACDWYLINGYPPVLLAKNEEGVFWVSILANGTEGSFDCSVLEFSLVRVVYVKSTEGSVLEATVAY